MRINTDDLTLKRNYLQKYRFLIREYEQIKRKEHPNYRFLEEFYRAHDTDRRSFLKYYNRYKQSGREEALLPRKRGPKWRSRRPLPLIEHKVLVLRDKGLNRYEIVALLKPVLKGHTPSPSGVYTILRRHGVNRLTEPAKDNRRRIIKTKAGELGHVDTHTLSKSVVAGESRHRHLVCVIDACTRIAWAEVIEDKTALTTMFAVMRCLNVLDSRYRIRFAEILTDNGPEFGQQTSGKKALHPFERLLLEMGIKHRYTRPYRPQTNGKAERFWRTIEAEVFEGTDYESVEAIKDELLHYLIYYNEHRPHQALAGETPEAVNQNCPRIT
jgi:transposase InsO family protein